MNRLKVLIFCLVYPAALGYNADKDIKGDPDTWATGIVYGKKIKTASTGLLFSVFESDILIPSPDYILDNLDPKNEAGSIRMSLSSYKTDVYKQLAAKTIGTDVILEYSYKHRMLNPTHWLDTQSTRYLVQKVSFLQPFHRTAAFKKYGFLFQVPDGTMRGHRDERTIKGHVHHVSRWGYVGGKTCTAYVYEPMMIEISEKVGEESSNTVGLHADMSTSIPLSPWSILQMLNPIGLFFQATTILNSMITPPQTQITVGASATHGSTQKYKIFKKQGLRVVPMNVYSNEGCSYAEDLVRSRRRVEVDFSISYWEWWRWHKNTALRFKVLPETTPKSVPSSKQKTQQDDSNEDE